MSEASPLVEFDLPAIHGTFKRDYTDRYIIDAGQEDKAFAVDYDPTDPLCDYNVTWHEAKPNPFSPKVGLYVVSKMNKIHPDTTKKLIIPRFATAAPRLVRGLREYPVALINGHNPDLLAAATGYAAATGLGEARPKGLKTKNLMDMYKIHHGMGTIGLRPMRIKLPAGQSISLKYVAQMFGNPHWSVPRSSTTEQSILDEESALTDEFMYAYNALFKAGCIDATKAGTNHPDKLNVLWTLAPGATHDQPGKDNHKDKLITAGAREGTSKLAIAMGVALVPVYASYGEGRRLSHLEIGKMVPPGEVTMSTIPEMLVDMAIYRRLHGERNVFASEELAV